MPAARQERRPWRETPLIESQTLSEAAGCRILLKLDNLQPGGSFKSRGIGNLIVRSLHAAKDPSAVHIYSSSGGNAGIAAVHAANFVGRPSTVVVPMSTKPMMIAKIRAAGASRVVQKGTSLKEADDYLKEVVMPEGVAGGAEPVYVNPYDHEWIWDGHASLVDEVREQMLREGERAPPGVIACSVGGGGLFNGIVRGVEDQWGWDKTQVLAVETEGAHSLDSALKEGELVTLPAITSLATSLGASRVSKTTLELAQKGIKSGRVRTGVLSDGEAAMGCIALADQQRTLVELACGVTVALCFDGRLQNVLGRQPAKDEVVVLIICGGHNVTTKLIEEWRTEYGQFGSTEVPVEQAPEQEPQPVVEEAISEEAINEEVINDHDEPIQPSNGAVRTPDSFSLLSEESLGSQDDFLQHLSDNANAINGFHCQSIQQDSFPTKSINGFHDDTHAVKYLSGFYGQNFPVQAPAVGGEQWLSFN